MSRLQSFYGRIRRTVQLLSNGRVQPVELPLFSAEEGYDRWAASYGEELTAVQVLESPILVELIPDVKDRRVLDLGCGTGRVSELAMAHGAKITVGVDLSREMLQRAVGSTKSTKSFWLAGDGLHLPFVSESFDVIICALTMGHLRDIEGGLAQIHRVLRLGGTLLLSDFHPYATFRGDTRSFLNPKDGKTYAIEQHCHLFEHYFECFNKLGIHLEDLREPQFEGFPLVFVMRAKKVSG
ncbi:MAG: class I SAM-dependent methyltransferase [bacterium]